MMTLDALNREHDAQGRARRFVEFARAVALTRSHLQAVDELERRHGVDDRSAELYRKAAHSTGNAEFLAWTRLSREFAALVERATVLGQLRNTIPIVIGGTTPLTNDDVVLDFVGESDPIPAAQLGGDVTLAQTKKLAGIIGVSKELLRVSDDQAISVLERHLVAVIRRAEDDKLLSTAAGTADAPAGLLEGVSAADTGGPLTDDVMALVAAVRSGAPVAPTFVTSLAGTIALAGAHLLSADGRLAGTPVIVAPSAGARVILIDGGGVGVADGGLRIDNARDATIEFSATPSGAGPFTSAFQANLALLRLTRYLTWTRGYDDVAAFINLPAAGSPA